MATSVPNRKPAVMVEVYDLKGKKHLMNNLNVADAVQHLGWTKAAPFRRPNAVGAARAVPAAAAEEEDDDAPLPNLSLKKQEEDPDPADDDDGDDEFEGLGKEDLVALAKDRWNVKVELKQSRVAMLSQIRNIQKSLTPPPETPAAEGADAE